MRNRMSISSSYPIVLPSPYATSAIAATRNRISIVFLIPPYLNPYANSAIDMNSSPAMIASSIDISHP